MEIQNGKRIYQIGTKVSKNPIYELFLCKELATNRDCLIQIPISASENKSLDKMSYFLTELSDFSEKLEEDYQKKNPGKELNYDLSFPEIVDSFYHDNDGEKIKVNVLAFRSVEKISDVVPLINLKQKDGLRIDLRSSGWILGKALKFLVLAHGLGLSLKKINGNNFLIVPENHYVIFLNMTRAELFDAGIPSETCSEDIAQVARTVISSLGGRWQERFIPNDGDDEFAVFVENQTKKKKGGGESEEEDTSKLNTKAFNRYTNFLFGLAFGNESDASRAHENFYELVNGLWKKEFYPFTTKPF